MKNRYDLIIFDWDGTLIDSIDWITHCLQNAGAVLGLAIPERQAAKDVIGLSIHNAMNTLFPTASDSQHDQLVRLYSEEYFSKQLSQNDLFEGVYAMLEQLSSAGYLLAVATGKTRVGLNQALHATATEHFFCATRCADETASKPNPLMLNQLMQYTNVLKERTLMIGDSIHDLQMANNADISCIGVSCGAHSDACLQAYQPIHCLKHTTELLPLILG